MARVVVPTKRIVQYHNGGRAPAIAGLAVRDRVCSVERNPCMYVMASGRHGTLYIGVTSDLLRRVSEHRSGIVAGFTCRHAVKRLVHFEMFDEMPEAIRREKQLKTWRREWKVNLIEAENPFWEDRAIWFGLSPLPSS